MDVQYHLDTSVAAQDHAEKVKNIEKILKANSDIDHGSWFKSKARTLQR